MSIAGKDLCGITANYQHGCKPVLDFCVTVLLEYILKVKSFLLAFSYAAVTYNEIMNFRSLAS